MGKNSTTLNEQDIEVLKLKAEGVLDIAIARRLGVSRSAITGRMTRVYRKLGATHATHAIKLAREKGLIDRPRYPKNTGVVLRTLSQHEGHVVMLLLMGYSSPEIAKHLDASPSSVSTCLNRVLRKFGAASKENLVAALT